MNMITQEAHTPVRPLNSPAMGPRPLQLSGVASPYMYYPAQENTFDMNALMEMMMPIMMMAMMMAMVAGMM